MDDKTKTSDAGVGGSGGVAEVSPATQANGAPWPAVDPFMSGDDLTAAADRIRTTVDWSRLPRLELFRELPSSDRAWHELVALTLTSLEVNGDALSERHRQASAVAPTQLRARVREILRSLRDGLARAVPNPEELQNVLWLVGEFERIALPDLSEPRNLHDALGRMVELSERNVETLADISMSLATFVKMAAESKSEWKVG